MFSRPEFVCFPGVRSVTPGKHTNSGLYRFMFAGSLNHKPGRFFQRILSGYRVHNFCVSLTTNQRNPWNPAGNHPEPGIHRNSGTSIRLETALRAVLMYYGYPGATWPQREVGTGKSLQPTVTPPPPAGRGAAVQGGLGVPSQAPYREAC